MGAQFESPVKSVQKESFTTYIQRRKCACGKYIVSGAECEECKKNRQATLRRAKTNSAWMGAVPPIVHEVLRSPGESLDVATRSWMEPRFGHDFGSVRVHADAKAAESARAVYALAYTVGRDVVFGTGQFSPTSTAGRKLIAHELAHVVQQQGASAIPDELQIGSPSDASELEAASASDTSLGSPAGSAMTPARQQVSRQMNPMEERASPSREPRRHARSTLPYHQAAELAECIRIMGDANAAYCRQIVLGEAPPPSPVRIVRQGGVDHSFISTDRITLTAGESVNWTVHGVSSNAGNGNPHQAANRTQFSFRPNPSRRPTSGSRTPNDPIQYSVEAQAGGRTGTFDLMQDETDIIRQEYIDLGPSRPPDRANIVSPSNATFNTGNYSLIVDGGMDNAFNSTETAFQALTPAGTVTPQIGVSSGYRNPRRNVAVGSNFPVGSRHVWGTALDLTVQGANATLWTRLRTAGANAGNSSICEMGPTQVLCTNANVDHVHIQW
jgi:Domain of unknown function (DUF4157)